MLLKSNCRSAYAGYMAKVRGISSDEDLLVALANTGHEAPDELADPSAFAEWWTAVNGSSSAAIAASEVGLLALVELRHVVREAALVHNGGRVPVRAPAPSAWSLALRPELSGGRVSLSPQDADDLATEVAAAVIVALLRATARPSWRRVKACPGTDCGWVFVDASRNSSRRWCDMAGCGNRAKTAAFRARRRDSP